MRALSSHYPGLSAIEQKRAINFKYEGTLKNKGKQIYLWSISNFIFNFQRFQRLKTKIDAYCPFGHAATEGLVYSVKEGVGEIDGGTSSCMELVIQRRRERQSVPLKSEYRFFI